MPDVEPPPASAATDEERPLADDEMRDEHGNRIKRPVIEKIKADEEIIIPEGHELSDRDSLTVQDLEKVALLLPPKGTSYRTELDRSSELVGISLTAQAEIDGVRLITSLAFDGVGVAIVPSTSVKPGSRGPWRSVPVLGMPPRHVGVVQRRRQHAFLARVHLPYRASF